MKGIGGEKGKEGKRRTSNGRVGMGGGRDKGTKEEKDGEKGREGMEREVTNPLSKSWIRPWNPAGGAHDAPQTP